jgi:hypothetical protein
VKRFFRLLRSGLKWTVLILIGVEIFCLLLITVTNWMLCGYPKNPAPLELVEATTKRYDHVRRLTGAYGARFLLVGQPLLWMENGKVDPGVKAQEKDLTIWGRRFLRVRENFTVTYNTLVKALQDKPYLVDCRNVLCCRTTPVYEVDGVHLKPQGNKLGAAGLAKVRQARGWLAAGTGPDKPPETEGPEPRKML